MDVAQLRDRVVRPALGRIGLWSLAAEQIVLGTMAKESGGFKWIHQVGGGPAVGLEQIEPATYQDTWDNFLRFRPALNAAVRSLMAPWPEGVDQLHGNLYLGAALCRIKYFRDKQPLPKEGDVQGMALAWKRVYNSAAGAGAPDEWIDHYRRLVAPIYGKD